jgi:hypothetical protein
MDDRYLDLLKQGFMKPRRKRAPRPPPEIVACDRCLDWHPKGKHRKPAPKP